MEEKEINVIERLLQEKIDATQHLLDCLLREVSADLQQPELIQALTDSLEELNAAAAAIQKQNADLLTSAQHIAQEHERYQELFEIAPNGYLVTDIKGRIQEANPIACQLLNVPPNFLVDKPLTVFVEKTSIPGFLSLLDQIQAHKQSVKLETIIKPRQKPSFSALLYMVKAYNSENKLIGLLWLIHDTTKVKQLEKERLYFTKKINEYQFALESSPLLLSEINRLSEIKSNFLSSISHELRTPLSNIKLALGALKDYLPPDPKTDGLLAILNKECNREIQLISDLLQIKVKEEKTIKDQLLALEMVQLSQWLPLLFQPYQQQVETKNIQFASTIEEDLEEFIIDTSLLKKVLLELLDNAYKYTPENGLISVKVQKGDNSCDTHPSQSIEIINTGPKIDDHDLWRIFEEFYRIPSEQPYAYSGMGIGLPLVLKSTQKLGATLRLQSSLDATVFTIELRYKNTAVLPASKETKKFEFIAGVVLANDSSSDSSSTDPYSTKDDLQID